MRPVLVIFLRNRLPDLLANTPKIQNDESEYCAQCISPEGGEDIMVEQEYQLLKKNKVAAEILYFKNATGRWQQLVQFVMAVYNPFSARRLNRWIGRFRPDIIHIHNWRYAASPSIIRAAKKKGIPVIHTPLNFRLLCPSGTLLHNNQVSSEYLTASFPWKAIRSKAYRNSHLQTFWLAFIVWATKIFGTWKHIDRFVAFTNHKKSVFQSSEIVSREKIMVKPNFIADVAESGEARDMHFLFADRLSEEKDLDILLRAFAHNGYPLKIIGEGPLKEMIVEYAEKYTNIARPGFKDKSSITKELKSSIAFIFSSIWYEGNPFTIIEALASGTAVITSKMGAMQSMIADGYNELHFTPGDENDLIGKLNYWQELSQKIENNFITTRGNRTQTIIHHQKTLENYS